MLAELEEMEQEELEKDLLEVETPSEPLDDSIAELPEVRKLNLNWPAWIYKLVLMGNIGIDRECINPAKSGRKYVATI